MEQNIKVVGWIHFNDECENIEIKKETIAVYFNAVKEEILSHGYCISGDEHQTHDFGVPVFSDGYCLRASMRAWGLLMAWFIDGNKDYMNYYMRYNMTKQCVFPSNSPDSSIFNFKYDKPVNLLKPIPYFLQEDIELINSSINNNMTLMTTDKVVEAIYHDLKNSK